MFRRLARYADRTLTVLKWPVAVLALLFLPAIGASLLTLGGEVILEPAGIVPFVAGFVGYWLLWHLAFRKPRWGALFSTFEHELTHALFAWLTFHKVVGLRATWRDGGEVRYRGRGNWLITVAPYFFPTLTVFAGLILALVPIAWGHAVGVVLGVTAAYHGTSTWLETHRRQPDIARVGLPFAIAFLPSANLVSLGLIVAFAHGGTASMGRLLGRAGDNVATWLSALF